MPLTPVLLLCTAGEMHVSFYKKFCKFCVHLQALQSPVTWWFSVHKTHLVYRETLPGQRCETARQGKSIKPSNSKLGDCRACSLTLSYLISYSEEKQYSDTKVMREQLA